MPEHAASLHRPRRSMQMAVLLAGALLVLAGAWALAGPNAQGSGVLVVIEDASPDPSGVFPGNVCYRLIRDSDRSIVSEGCLSIAASITAPAGFNRSVTYTIEVTLADARCTLLDDPRTGTGTIPFRVRVSCGLTDARLTGAADSALPVLADQASGSASASPVALPIDTRP